jgi:leader peptidase (prepilin peptidase)/N-methyltransferase
MEWWAAPIAGLVGFAAGLLAAGSQWRLYREPEFREQRLAGRRLFATRLFLGGAAGAAAALAFRPDHYDFGPALMAAAWCLVLLVLSSTDFERRRIPNRLTYPAMVAAAALSWAWPDRSAGDIWIGFAVALGGGTALFALGIVAGMALGTGEPGFGMGDVKLIALLGLVLGWPAIMGAAFIGIVAAGVVSLFYLVRRQGRRFFSYGPYLAAAGVIALLFPSRFL